MTTSEGGDPTSSGEDATPAALGPHPDPQRIALSRSMFETSSLDSVSTAIAAATEYERTIYVERMESGWRWSLVHRGGPYPLLRITARFLRMDHSSLRMNCHGHESGFWVLSQDQERRSPPQAWAIVEFSGPTGVDEARRRIQDALPDVTAAR